MLLTATNNGALLSFTPRHGEWSVREFDGRQWVITEHDAYDVLTRVDDLHEFAGFWRRELIWTREFALERSGDVRRYLERAEWTKAGGCALEIADLASRQAIISDTLILAEILGLSESVSDATKPVADSEAHRIALGRFGRLRQRLVSLVSGRHA
jgi:hypothetical protein